MNQMSGTQLLRIGHSPDPDDAFMFYALAKDKIDTGRYRFKHILQDIQTLNDRAMRGELEITAISIHAYPYVADKYALMSCGASMGDKYGPMIVSRELLPGESGLPDLDRTRQTLLGKTIAIPGTLTSAFLALQLVLGKGVDEGSGFRVQGSAESAAHRSSLNPEPRTLNPFFFHYVVVPFDQIPQFVLAGKADAGLLIHEGQLTYKQMGLHLLLDLGVWWYEITNLPLPLGGNVVRKDLGGQVMQDATNLVKQSIQYSLEHRGEAVDYALQYGRDLDRNLADRFVAMYVNKWTLDYGPRGREAIQRFLSDGAKAGLVPSMPRIDFVTAKG